MAGGDQLMYIGTYAGNIQIFDETTETMVGDIKLKTGIPRSLTLSQSRKKFYVLDSTLEKIEIVDIATRASLSTFTLSEGNKKVRIRGMQVDPLERFLILLTRSATKQIDRWEIGDITHAALRSRAEEGDAHHSVAARRRARVHQHPVLARRQAAVFLRRRRADPRDRRTSPRSTPGR